jgi:hypothetical protein
VKRQLCSQQTQPVLDVEGRFNEQLLQEYEEFWGGEFLGPRPPWVYLLLLHFRLKDLARSAKVARVLP